MRIFALQAPIYKLARLDPSELSPTAQARLRKLEAFERLRAKGIRGQEAAELLEVSRPTLYRWRRRLQRHGPRGLEPRSRRPRRTRQPCYSPQLVHEIETLRRKYPAWGKAKLTVLLRRQCFVVSESTVGRILHKLVRRGILHPVPRLRARHLRARQMRRFHAQRLPKNLPPPTLPGERIQIDPLNVTPQPGSSLKHFNATCPLSKWTVAEPFTSATSTIARRFLDLLDQRFPFPIHSLQVDGGSEFRAEFEAECQRRGLPLYVLPPRSPKLNPHVERRQDTWRAEFYEIYDLPANLHALRPHVHRYEHLYNHIRPHQALNGLTPAEYLRLHHPGLAPRLSHM